MFKKSITAVFTIMFLVTAVFQSLGAEEINGRTIMEKVENRFTGHDRVADMTMTLIKASGRRRVRKVKIWLKKYGKNNKTLMKFLLPDDVRGTGFLIWSHKGKDDDQWLYLPVLKRVRRISTSEKGKSFMGTDFSYEDLGSYTIDDYNYTILRSETFDGHNCWVVKSVPIAGKKKSYSKSILWVRKDSFFVVKIDFYDKRGDFLKRLHSTDIKKIDGILTAMKMEMENVRKKQRTILEFENVKYNTGLKDSIFSERNLKRE